MLGNGRINLVKTPFFIIFLVVIGIVVSIGAVFAGPQIFDNIIIDNSIGDSVIEIKSSTGDSKLTLTDEGTRSFSIEAPENSNKLGIVDEKLARLELQ